MLVQIEPKFTGRYALLHMGFRPFFALAALGSSGLMLAWLFLFSGKSWMPQPSYQITAWHAHEMTFGFGLAVVAGFLLTAVRNWTGRDTAVGWPLLALALLWLGARLAPFVLDEVWAAAWLEGGFLLGLLIAISRPIFQVKQWKQMGILSKILLFIPASLAFHFGVAGVWPAGISVGLYAGFYLLLALVLTLARRVMPMFIERGLNNGFLVRNREWLDRASLLVFLVFAVLDTCQQAQIQFAGMDILVSLLAATLAWLHAKRLAGWYHRDVWQKPMVWILVLAYLWLILGFFLKAVPGLFGMTHSLAIHALASGGMALVIVGMMSRVSLGHTGRNVNQPPAALPYVFLMLAAVPLLRVLAIWLFPGAYTALVHASQGLWVLAFAAFAVIYVPMLIRARIDGTRG